MDPDVQLDALQRRYKELELDEEESITVNIPAPITQREEFYFVGVLFQERDINEQAFIKTMAQVWQPRYGVHIKHIGPEHRFLITFYHPKDHERVWKGCPWNFKNRLLALTPRKVQDDPSTLTVTLVPMWIQIFGAPAGFISMQVCEAIGRFCGELLEVDEKNFKVIKPMFLRVRATIDVSKPLKRRMRLKLNGNTSVMVEFSYERLPSICYICGMFEHNEETCPLTYASADPPKRMYDESIRATVKSNLLTPECKWLRDENGQQLTQKRWKLGLSTSGEGQSSLCKQRQNVVDMEEDYAVEVTDPKRKRGSILADISNSLAGHQITSEVAGSNARAREEP